MNKKVTICIQSYNHGDYIEKCINSILRQDYKYKNILIFDDGSKDDSIKIIRKLSKKDKIIKLIKTKTPFNQSNFNKIISKSKKFGNYFTVFHSDDMYEKNIISEQVEFMDKNKKILAVGTGAYLINEKDNVVGKIKTPDELKNLSIIDKKNFINLLFTYGFFLMTPSFMYRTSFFKKKKLFYDYSKFGWAADVGFFYELSKYGKIGFITKELLNYRLSSVSTSQILKNTKITIGDIFKVLKYCLKDRSINKQDRHILNKKMNFLLMHEITMCNINRSIKNLPLLKNNFIENINQGCKSIKNLKKLFFSFLIQLLFNFYFKNKIFIKILNLINKK